MRKTTLIMACMLFGLACYALAAPDGQKLGVIFGIVVDEGGAPVANATVNWYDLEPKNEVEVQAGVRPFVRTDGDGHFSIEHLTVGDRYALVAAKEEAGYPDISQPLYNPHGKAQIVVARPKDQGAEVRIQLGPKAARLEWNVKDAVTGAAVPGIGFSIYRQDKGGEPKDHPGRPPVGGSAPGHWTYLIPSDVPVTIQFSADGYKTWYYPGVTEKARTTYLEGMPGETIKLNVFLQPEAAKSK